MSDTGGLRRRRVLALSDSGIEEPWNFSSILGYQKNFSDVLPILDISMRFSGFLEDESTRHSKLKHARRREVENLIGPAPYPIGLVPRVIKINAECTLVRVH
jgi:hypothetical protein